MTESIQSMSIAEAAAEVDRWQSFMRGFRRLGDFVHSLDSLTRLQAETEVRLAELRAQADAAETRRRDAEEAIAKMDERTTAATARMNAMEQLLAKRERDVAEAVADLNDREKAAAQRFAEAEAKIAAAKAAARAALEG